MKDAEIDRAIDDALRGNFSQTCLAHIHPSIERRTHYIGANIPWMDFYKPGAVGRTRWPGNLASHQSMHNVFDVAPGRRRAISSFDVFRLQSRQAGEPPRTEAPLKIGSSSPRGQGLVERMEARLRSLTHRPTDPTFLLPATRYLSLNDKARIFSISNPQIIVPDRLGCVCAAPRNEPDKALQRESDFYRSISRLTVYGVSPIRRIYTALWSLLQLKLLQCILKIP